MFQIYTPREWAGFFQSPSLIIDDNWLIWEADQYYRVLFASPSGRIDFTRGHIYGKGLGYHLSEAPIGYISVKNGVTEIRGSAGTFSSPILYIRDNKIYTPDRFYSVLDNPSGYIRNDSAPSGGASTSSNPSNNYASSGGPGIGTLLLMYGIGVILVVWIFLIIESILPLWALALIGLAMPAWVAYYGWFGDCEKLRVRIRSKLPADKLKKRMRWGFWVVLVVYIVWGCYFIPKFI